MYKFNLRIEFQVLLCCIFGLHGVALNAQIKHSCGDYHKPESKMTNPDDVAVYDRFGNAFTKLEVDPSKSMLPVSTCSNGSTFEVNFVGSFSIAEEETVCKVFEDLVPTLKVPLNTLKYTVNKSPNIQSIAVGSAYYAPLGCGFSNSLIWEKMNSTAVNNPPISPNGVDGYVIINENISFFTLQDENNGNDIGSQQYDLYSVVLHEILHSLGFASMITDNGAPNHGFYSNYDRLLFHIPQNSFLIKELDTPVNCCDENEFNPSITFGSLLNAACGVLKLDVNGSDPAVNNTFVNSVVNSLSHLDEGCSGNQYVMRPNSPSGPLSIRRQMHPQEIQVLCHLGMRDCSSVDDCVVVAMDDFVEFSTVAGSSNSIYEIAFTELFENDFYEGGNASGFQIIDDCGDESILNVTVNQSGQKVIINNLPFGNFVLCYSAKTNSCDACDQAFIYIHHEIEIDLPDLPACNNIDCGSELFCNGDFDSFLPIPQGIIPNSDPFYFQQGLASCWIGPGSSPDLVWLGGDNIAFHSISGDSGFEGEPFFFPLQNGIQPGCKVNVSFNAVDAIPFQSNPIPPPVIAYLYASHQNPCGLGFPLFDCSQTVNGYYCMNENGIGINIPQSPPLPLPGQSLPSRTIVSCNSVPDYPIPTNIIPCSVLPFISRFDNYEQYFGQISFEWENTTNEVINYISLTSKTTGTSRAGVYDDFSVTLECDNSVAITPISEPTAICVGGQTEITYEICATTLLSNPDPISITLTPNISLDDSGFTVSGDFNPTAPYATTFQLTPNGNCHQVTLIIDLTTANATVLPPAGNNLNIDMDVVAFASCIEPNSDLSTTIEIINEAANSDFTYDAIGDCLVNFNSDYDEGAHTWNFGDGTATSNEINPTHQYPTNGTFTATHTVSNACDTKTETLPVVVNCNPPPQGCSCPVGSIVIGTPGMTRDLSEFFGPGPNQIPQVPTGPLNIIVQGNINIDEDYEFLSGSNICMGPGVGIKLNSSRTLTLTGTYVRGCDRLWQGINLMSFSKLITRTGDTGRTVIEDALYAVNNQNGGIYLSGTDFNRNYGCVTTAVSGSNLGIYDCRFLCGDCENIGLKPHFQNQQPSFRNTRWGIYMASTGVVTIGNTSEPANIFDGISSGVVAFNSYFSVVNSQFSNIRDEDLYNDDFEGTAIYGQGEFTFFQGSQFANTCSDTPPMVSINNCTEGMHFKGMKVSISRNTLVGVRDGIIVENAKNKRINICDNNITATNYGIKLLNNDPATFILVKSNQLNVQSFLPPDAYSPSAAILVEESLGAQTNAIIQDNEEIFIKYRSDGIKLSNCNGWKVTNNNVMALDNDTRYVRNFNLENCDRLLVDCNASNRDNSFFLYNSGQGYRALATPNTRYICNTTNGNGIGLSFDMPCDNSAIIGTDIGGYFIGLNYRETAVTGKQPEFPGSQNRHGNKWGVIPQGSGALGAAHGGGDVDFRKLSEYTVQTNNNTYYPPPSVLDWFTVKPGSFHACTGANSCPEIADDGDPDETKTELDIKVANGEVDPGVYSEPTKWIMEYRLYEKLYNNPGLSTGEVALSNFYLTKSNSSIGLFTPIKAGIRDLFKLDNATAAHIESLQQAMDAEMTAIATIDEQLPTATGASYQQLLTQRSQALQSLEAANASFQTLSESVETARNAQADNLIAQNAAIAIAQVFEENEKSVNDIYLKTIGKGINSLNDGQQSVLEGIANQCVYAGGTAVIRARGLLTIMGIENLYDDELLCQSNFQSGQVAASAISSNNVGVKALPNPTNDRFTLLLDEPFEQEGNLTLTNAFGQAMATYKLEPKLKSYEFSTSELPVGVYFLGLKEGKKNLTAIRLVVMR